jgi:hypothetical protein
MRCPFDDPIEMARLFIAQERLDSWTLEEKVKVDGDTMVLAGDGRAFRLVPAVRFLSVADGPTGSADDPQSMIGRVKSEDQLVQMGADHLMSSVIHGEIAYNVQSGFLGIPLPSA